MANYYGVGRSNYFRVKDAAALTAALGDYEYEVIAGRDPNVVTVLACNESGGWTAYKCGDAASGEDDEEVDIIDLIVPYLATGEVAVFETVGNENLRYLSGRSIAVNSSGKRVAVDLEDIFEVAAAEFGVDKDGIAAAIY